MVNKVRKTASPYRLPAYARLCVVALGILLYRPASASTCHMLWSPASGMLSGVELSLSDYVASGISSFKYLPAPIAPGTVSYVYNDYGGGPGGGGHNWNMRKGALLLIKNIVEVNGIRLTVRVDGWNKLSDADGYTLYRNERTTGGWGNQCWPQGAYYNEIHYYTPDAQVIVSASPSQTLYPGKYNISVPYVYGFEELKYDRSPNDRINDIRNSLVNGPKSSLDVALNVTSQCSINTRLISLSHGTLTPDAAKLHTSKASDVHISCTNSVNVRLRLLGAQTVPGRTANFTDCGNGGQCELKLDSGGIDEVVSVTQNKTVSITSTLHPKVGGAVEGVFEGNGVLEVTIL